MTACSSRLPLFPFRNKAPFIFLILFEFCSFWFSHNQDWRHFNHLAGSQQFNQVKNSNSSDKKGALLESLEPCTLQALYELMSLVHNSVEASDQKDIAESTSQDTSASQGNERKKTSADDSSLLEQDPVAKIILPVEPLELRSMLLVMVVCIILLKINQLIP